jgi:hypothetical protein
LSNVPRPTQASASASASWSSARSSSIARISSSTPGIEFVLEHRQRLVLGIVVEIVDIVGIFVGIEAGTCASISLRGG